MFIRLLTSVTLNMITGINESKEVDEAYIMQMWM